MRILGDAGLQELGDILNAVFDLASDGFIGLISIRPTEMLIVDFVEFVTVERAAAGQQLIHRKANRGGLTGYVSVPECISHRVWRGAMLLNLIKRRLAHLKNARAFADRRDIVVNLRGLGSGGH